MKIKTPTKVQNYQTSNDFADHIEEAAAVPENGVRVLERNSLTMKFEMDGAQHNMSADGWPLTADEKRTRINFLSRIGLLVLPIAFCVGSAIVLWIANALHTIGV